MNIVLTPDKELPPNVGKLIDQLVHNNELIDKDRDRMKDNVLYGILSKESIDKVPEFLHITGTASYLNKVRNRQMNVVLGSKGIRIERPKGVWTLDDLARLSTTPAEREKEQREAKLVKRKVPSSFDSIENSQLGGGRRRTRRGGHDHISRELEKLTAHGQYHGVVPPPPMPDGGGDLVEIWDKFGKALHAGLKSMRNALTRKRNAKSSTLGRTAGRGGRRRRTRRRS